MSKKEVVDEVMRVLQITDERFRKRAEKLYDKYSKNYSGEDLVHLIAYEL